MITISTVAGNTLPSRDFTLEHNGSVIDLSTASSVTMKIKNAQTGDITNAGSTLVIQNPPGNGVVRFTALATDFPEAGRYVCEVDIIFGAGEEALHEQVVVVARDPYN